MAVMSLLNNNTIDDISFRRFRDCMYNCSLATISECNKYTNRQYGTMDFIKEDKKYFYYEFNKERFKPLIYLKNTKTEFKKYFSLIRREEYEDRDRDHGFIDYIIKKNNHYFFGNTSYTYENLPDFLNGEYSFYHDGDVITKQFENDLILRFIEIYCILHGIIQLEDVEVNETLRMKYEIEESIDTDDIIDFMGNQLRTRQDKWNTFHNWDKILYILNVSDNRSYCPRMDYDNLFKIIRLIK